MEGNLLAILDLDETFAQYESLLKSGQDFIAELSEQKIFEFYIDALKANHFLPFEGFSKSLEQMYLRLKLNVVN